ncbi:hypothetical protein MKMG_01216 [Methanogenium sp. MK-MG]|nr:hypothetical protein MKMG_01216 [Methanogenium sp. MK-MG]
MGLCLKYADFLKNPGFFEPDNAAGYLMNAICAITIKRKNNQYSQNVSINGNTKDV